jgi:hypothetical protein
MPAADYLAIEKQLAGAHRTLWKAAIEADRMGYRTLATDLEQILEEVGRVCEDMLKGRR